MVMLEPGIVRCSNASRYNNHWHGRLESGIGLLMHSRKRMT